MKPAAMTNDVFYFLDRNAYNVNVPEDRVVEMEIIIQNNTSYGHAQQGHFTLKFEISLQLFEDDDKSKRPMFFATREEAEAQYARERDADVQAVLNKPKDELLKQFFQLWSHESIADSAVYDAMVEKIRTDFGVDVLQES